MKKFLPFFLCLIIIFTTTLFFTGCTEAIVDQEIQTLEENNMKLSVFNKLDGEDIVDTYAVVTKYMGTEHIDHFTIPATTTGGIKITKIASLAFYKKDISFLTIAENITTIENFAFGYSSLKEVTLPSTVEKIGDYAFVNCIELYQVSIKSSSVPELGIYAFKTYVEDSENKDPYEVWDSLTIKVPSVDSYYTEDKASNWYDYRNNLAKIEVTNG